MMREFFAAPSIAKPGRFDVVTIDQDGNVRISSALDPASALLAFRAAMESPHERALSEVQERRRHLKVIV